MKVPRRDKMNPLEIETHHMWSRCVRGSFLLGVDPETGVDVSHRRAMLEALTEYQVSVFAVDWGTDHYLTNHLHGVGRNRPDIAQKWSDEEVAWRWKMAWPSYDPDRGWGRAPTDEEVQELLLRDDREPGHLQKLRKNLSNLSWFIARIKQPISYLANRDEANKKERRGHFWEGRYGNRKLNSFRDTLNSFLYNDVQQVRAGIVDRLEESDYSAIQRQLASHAARAFRDMHQRKPNDTDEDHAELERLEALFSNCYYSPLDANAPLMTEADDNPPACELVLPAGYYHRPQPGTAALVTTKRLDTIDELDEEADEVDDVEGLGEAVGPDDGAEFGAELDGAEAADSLPLADDDVPVEASATSEAFAEGQPGRRGDRNQPKKGRGKRKSRSIHNRLKRKQRRRASRSSILGLDADQYFGLVRTLAERIVAERSDNGSAMADAELTSGDPRDAQPDETPTTFYRSLKDFSVWAYSQAAAEIEKLIASKAELPRPPT